MPTARTSKHLASSLLALALVASGCSDGGDDTSASDRDDASVVAPATEGTEGGADRSGGETSEGETPEGETSEDETSEDDDGRGQEDDGAGSPDGGFGGIPDVVEEVEPSVVTVVTDAGSGSGVVYDENGTIITNNHVVDGAGSFTVVFADQVRTPARVVATAPLLDLAILEADRRDLPPATFADELPRVGELAIAMGSPLGLEQTVTAGIVSGLNRGIPGSARITQSLVNLIQTDAPISPGNSGGALVDRRGQVIGINVAYLPPTAGAVSLGFAIPSPEVVDAVEEMLETGQVTLAYIGVVPAAITPQIAERFRLEDTQGVLVAEVEPGGPAATAGLEPGDLVTSVAGEGTGTVEAFLGILRRQDPGDVVEVELLRDGEERTFDVTLTDRPET